MSFYKIIKNGVVIDANNKFYKYQENRKRIIECKQEFAQLISLSDKKEFYRTEWLKPLPDGVSKPEIEANLISEEEYNKLKEELSVNKVVMDVPQQIEEPILELQQAAPILPQEEVMTAAEMRKRILQLEELVQKLISK